MARRISRKQLKQDDFVEAAFDFGHWIEENWADLLKWVTAGVLALVVGLAAFAWMKNRRETAGQDLARALMAYEQAEIDGFGDPAALQELLERFDTTGGRVSGTSAKVAGFYEGVLLYRLGRHDEAVSQLESVANSATATPTLSGTARIMLAEVHADAGHADQAVSVLQAALENPGPGAPADQTLLRLGEMHRKAGRTEQAREAWQRIVDEFATSPAANQARQNLADLAAA